MPQNECICKSEVNVPEQRDEWGTKGRKMNRGRLERSEGKCSQLYDHTEELNALQEEKRFWTEEEWEMINGPTTNHTHKQMKRFQETCRLQISECWRLLYWATRGKARHRGGWTQKGRPHCQLRTEAGRPSFRTWAHPEPTNPPMGRTPTPAGSEREECKDEVQNAPQLLVLSIMIY